MKNKNKYISDIVILFCSLLVLLLSACDCFLGADDSW